MQFALVNNARSTAQPKTSGICQFCGGNMVPKCGSKTIWHWAHAPKRSCDPWWENETPWHREWKSYFPETWRELVHEDPTTGEKHIADVKTATGRVIEFQNSPMPPHELRSRETFYGNMIWIVNGDKFRNNFYILDALPDPDAAFAQDIVFHPQTLEKPTYGFWRKSENPDYKPGGMVLVHTVEEPSQNETRRQIYEHYVGHHMFDWKRPRSVWFESKRPVFFHFAHENLLLRLSSYPTYGSRVFRCVQFVAKQEVIESNGGVYHAREPAR
jgi:competence protein CoiA